MNDTPDHTAISGEDADYLMRRRALVKKLAAGAIATPVVLSSVSAKAAIPSSPLPPG